MSEACLPPVEVIGEVAARTAEAFPTVPRVTDMWKHSFFLLSFCIALSVHYILIRREARMLRKHNSPPSLQALPRPPDTNLSDSTATKAEPANGGAHLKMHMTAPTKAPSADMTAPVQRNEETGEVLPSVEEHASAMALVQRVRDLGLHLGDVVVTGISIGLPNAESELPVFSPGNIAALMEGKNFIGKLPAQAIQAQLNRRVVQARLPPLLFEQLTNPAHTPPHLWSSVVICTHLLEPGIHVPDTPMLRAFEGH